MTVPRDHTPVDHISDPALNDTTGHDWADEGGALPDGPAAIRERDGESTRSSSQSSNSETSGAHVSVEDPRSRFPKISPPVQTQPEPGLDALLDPQADHGQHSYCGTGRLQGLNALVTGADSGIGAAVAIAFAREGANVAITYLPSEEQDATNIVATIEEAGVRALTLPGDLSDHAYRDQIVPRVVAEFGSLDILVNNAGKQVSIEDIKELSDEQVAKTFEVNVFGTFALSRAAAEVMKPGSSIINTTSIQAYEPSPHLLDYAATKAAINNFTKGLAAQLGPKGIRVNAVAPGPIWTPLQPSYGQPPEKLQSFGHDTWLGRAGQPAELAPAYVFLASNESSYVLGETLHVNGGRATP